MIRPPGENMPGMPGVFSDSYMEVRMLANDSHVRRLPRWTLFLATFAGQKSNARRTVQRLFDGIEVAISDQFLGHYRQRLWHVAQCLRALADHGGTRGQTVTACREVVATGHHNRQVLLGRGGLRRCRGRGGVFRHRTRHGGGHRERCSEGNRS